MPLIPFLLLAGCGGNSSPSGNSTDNTDSNSNTNSTSNNNVTPVLPGTADSDSLPIPAPWSLAAKPIEPAPLNVAGQTALLNEVLFLPAAGDSQFVEIRPGAGGTDPSGMSLQTESGDTYKLPDGLAVLSEADLLLVKFDGKGTVDGLTVHADRNTFLNTTAGSVTLLDPAGSPLDSVSWSANGSPSLAFGVSGAPFDIEPGITYGRLPQSNEAIPHSWMFYAAVEATPGAPNVNVGVEVLFPQNGAVLNSGDTILSWYPAPDAVGYEVQLADNADLNSPLLDTTVTDPMTSITLPQGSYYWRVQAQFADGSLADWSLTQIFTLDDSVDLSDQADPAGMKSARQHKGTIPLALLPVPLISQRKDTNMLLTESIRTDSGHGWDEPHPTLDIKDWADNMNCAFASVQMVNHFFQGHLSQDRIGFEHHRDDQDGPEFDLNYGQANPVDDILGWAVGRNKGVLPYKRPKTYGEFWNDITGEIDAGRPVVMLESLGKGAHFTVVVGYDIRNSKRYFVVNNPWNPNSAVGVRGLRQYDLIPLRVYDLLGPGTLSGISDEASIGVDSDGDGVYDFDEEMRFGTDKTNPDSDGDCITDKDEVRMSMFGPNHGWATFYNKKGGDGAARTKPVDGPIPTTGRPELDSDSDGGGVPDFVEDLNHNGSIDLGETDPNNKNDDRGNIQGTYDVVRHTVLDVSMIPNYSYNSILIDGETHVTFTAHTDPGNKITGAAHIKQTGQLRYKFRYNINCPPDQIEYYDMTPREYDAQLTGAFECFNSNGFYYASLHLTADPDGHTIQDVENITTCQSTSPLVQTSNGDKWTGIDATLVNNNSDYDDKQDGFLRNGDSGVETGTAYSELKFTLTH